MYPLYIDKTGHKNDIIPMYSYSELVSIVLKVYFWN